LATDIDPEVVSFAAGGVYPLRLLSGVPENILSKYFEPVAANDEQCFRANRTLRSKVVFKELNLLADWPMKKGMDVIFCRNVVIYFDSKTQKSLWPRFHSILIPDGYLFLGHSERISGHEAAGFLNEGPTSYRRIADR
jgi:chemotaxis protein methyltransferase CheR